MNASRLISAEATVALAGAVTGDLIAQGSARTFPRPRQILTVFLFYGAMSLIASLGAGAARFAATAGGVLALTSLVLGATGRNIEQLLIRVANLTQQPEGAPPAGQQQGVLPQLLPAVRQPGGGGLGAQGQVAGPGGRPSVPSETGARVIVVPGGRVPLG